MLFILKIIISWTQKNLILIRSIAYIFFQFEVSMREIVKDTLQYLNFTSNQL